MNYVWKLHKLVGAVGVEYVVVVIKEEQMLV